MHAVKVRCYDKGILCPTKTHSSDNKKKPKMEVSKGKCIKYKFDFRLRKYCPLTVKTMGLLYNTVTGVFRSRGVVGKCLCKVEVLGPLGRSPVPLEGAGRWWGPPLETDGSAGAVVHPLVRERPGRGALVGVRILGWSRQDTERGHCLGVQRLSQVGRDPLRHHSDR